MQFITPPADIGDFISYDPDNGSFAWRQPRGGRKPAVGGIGTVSPQGYLVITFRGKHYLAHRLGWLLAKGKWPELLIDHISGDRGDNRLRNLRLATHVENSRNTRPRSGASTGVTYDARYRRPYIARIRSAGVKTYIGSFATEAEANAAYLTMATKLHGEFARVE